MDYKLFKDYKLYGIKDFNIKKNFLKEKKLLYRDIQFFPSWYKILVISPTPIRQDDVFTGKSNIMHRALSRKRWFEVKTS